MNDNPQTCLLRLGLWVGSSCAHTFWDMIKARARLRPLISGETGYPFFVHKNEHQVAASLICRRIFCSSSGSMRWKTASFHVNWSKMRPLWAWGCQPFEIKYEIHGRSRGFLCGAEEVQSTEITSFYGNILVNLRSLMMIHHPHISLFLNLSKIEFTAWTAC